MITPVAIESIGYKYYIVYTLVGFCIPFSVYFLYPEVGSSHRHHLHAKHKADRRKPWA